MNQLKRERLLMFKQLREYGVVLSRRWIDKMEQQGKFPKRVELSEWRVAWVESEVIKWVEDRIAARETEVPALGSGRKVRGARGKA